MSPILNHDQRFLLRVEDLTVEQFIAQLAVETFAIEILPGTARLDESAPGSTVAIQSRGASATNSGPLSERMYAGTPRETNGSQSASMTSWLSVRRAADLRTFIIGPDRTILTRFCL